MSAKTPKPEPSAQHEILERAHSRARQFHQGFLQGAPSAERQEWMKDAAELLDLLVNELRTRLPPESYHDFIARHRELGVPAPPDPLPRKDDEH